MHRADMVNVAYLFRRIFPTQMKAMIERSAPNLARWPHRRWATIIFGSDNAGQNWKTDVLSKFCRDILADQSNISMAAHSG
jgi:hypothetical protein